MSTETNVMGVPEVRNYRRGSIEGGIVITYEVRQPGERGWTPVRCFTPDKDVSAPAEDCIRSQKFVSRGY